MGKENKIEKILSASRIKNLESCHWSYWCKYHLGLPETNNEGAMRGSVCHLVFELLLVKKHKKHFNLITKEGHIEGSPAVTRLVNKHLNAYDINTEENYELVSDMILVGLHDDFFCAGAKLLDPEYEFNLKNSDPAYSVRGFIDKAAKYTKENKILIKDYKSSKKRFEGSDLTANLQGMIYSLVATKTWPKLKPVVQFCFLKFPNETIQELEFTEEQLAGLEHYLSHCYKVINNFTEETARCNFAADQPFPGKNEGFKGPLNCGFAKYPGHLKKDGNVMWHCAYKFAFEYYQLTDEFGSQIKTAFTEEELSPKDGEKVVKKKYGGCPKHHQQNQDDDDFGF